MITPRSTVAVICIGADGWTEVELASGKQLTVYLYGTTLPVLLWRRCGRDVGPSRTSPAGSADRTERTSRRAAGEGTGRRVDNPVAASLNVAETPVTITLHVVSSLDGFVAKHDNTVGWLDSPDDAYERGVSEHPTGDGLDAIDCFVLGSRTYEHALQLGWPYGDTPTVVVTSRALPSVKKTVEFYSGDLGRLVSETLAPRFRNVWLVGGAHLCQSFLKLGLVDEIRLSIAPVLLGDGLSLFGTAGHETRWRLKDVVPYKTGFVELVYRSDSGPR